MLNIRKKLKQEKYSILKNLDKNKKAILSLPYISNEEIYKQATKECVIPHPIKNRAKLLGFTFLNMDINSDKDKELWEIRIRDYEHMKGEEELNIDKFFDIKESIRELKQTALKIINTMNYETNAESCWNLMIRMFTKRRP